MTEVIEQQPTTTSETDLVAAIRHVLEASDEPLTLSKIRAALPGSFRSLSLEELGETLRRQVAANVLVQYPRYRSQQDRFWDRSMRTHLVHLLRAALQEQPLAASELRRKLPDYAKTQAEAVLDEEVTQGNLYRHPPANSRSGPRFSVEPPDPRAFLRSELVALFTRLERLGFNQGQLRQSALELLHEEEWASPPPAETPAEANAPAVTAEAPSAPDDPGRGYSWREEAAPATPTSAGSPAPPPQS
jgi:hypothetical protein